MCKAQCLLAFIALSINLVYSWDIAITSKDQLVFYTNQTKVLSERGQFKDLTALAYDAVHNMLLFVDKQSDNASIFSYNLTTKKYQHLVGRTPNENIQGLAFDPVSGKLFWTDSGKKSIFWISLKPGRPKNGIYGNVLTTMIDETPRAIVVDSCRGYIYWTNINVPKSTIERAKLDGTERKTIVDTNIYMPVGLAIDQNTKRLYWADDREGIHYSIESSDLEGNNRKTLVFGARHSPNALSVSKDYVYWVDWAFKSVWRIPKNSAKPDIEPEQLATFKNESPFGLVSNYQIEDQAASIPECAPLANLNQSSSAIDDSFNISAGLFCIYGEKDEEQYSRCKCYPGYTGDRCMTSVCENFCLQGYCTVTDEGQPKCTCREGFTGERCQNDACNGHCLNDGSCSLESSKPVCTCADGYEGARCETLRPPVISTQTPTETSCNCTDERSNSVLSHIASTSADGGIYVDSSCSDGWDAVRDPILMVLGAMCALLSLCCAVLITKILQLKRRPRIKRHIIVNKNGTPLTARPDQCEITIENCCNMNICETPCFEPRNTIRPTLLDAKPGKEEKKNLIANMENPDDLY